MEAVLQAIRSVSKGGSSEADHKRQYPNHHYAGEWLIREASVSAHRTLNGITVYTITVKSNQKEWEVFRRYSDFTDLNFHLNQIESYSTLHIRNSDVSAISRNINHAQDDTEESGELRSIFANLQNPLPKKSMNGRNFHMIPSSSSFLQVRMTGLHNWLTEVLEIVISDEQLDDVDRKRAQYELNWFLESGDHLR